MEFVSVEKIKNNAGEVFAYRLSNDDYEFNFQKKLQRYLENKVGRVVFTVNFKKRDFSIVSKRETTSDEDCSLVNCVLNTIEEENFDVISNCFLIMTKNTLISGVESMENEIKKFEDTGYWSWPINTDPNMYLRLHEKQKKIINDIEQLNIKYE